MCQSASSRAKGPSVTLLLLQLPDVFPARDPQSPGPMPGRQRWGRKLKPFRNVDVAKVAYLTVAQAQRLINAADPDFRLLVRAALETGCRYSELTRMTV